MNEERNHDGSVLATEPLLSNSAHQTDTNNGNNIHVQIVRYPTQAHQQEEEDQRQSFLHFILRSQGPLQLMILSLLFALALGATVGVVPAVLTDQYAKLYYGFDAYDHCSNYSTKDSKPQPCLDGSSDAQTAAAISSFISNAFTFFTSSVIGTLSDQYGRRGFLILGQFLSCLAPTALVLIQMFPTVKPRWYYIATSLSGMISWISIALSSLSDVVPNHWRAPVFGLLLSAFSLGFAFSPLLALKMTHYTVSMVSFILLLFGLLYSIVSLPETLTEDARVSVYEMEHERQSQSESVFQSIKFGLIRPFQELSILNRNRLFQLLSSLAFFSGMSASADQTLLIYYAEDHLSFNDHDIAILFMLIGVLGIIVQGLCLKYLTDRLGERLVVVISFLSGAIKNAMYALASKKEDIIVAAAIGSFANMSFPTISAMKANNVSSMEQGRIQGALYALSSLASAVGPLILKYVSTNYSEHTNYPGSYFLVATMFMLIATGCAYVLPKDKANSSHSTVNDSEHVRA